MNNPEANDNPRDERENDTVPRNTQFALHRMTSGENWPRKTLACPAHGEYEAVEKPGGWTSCPQCHPQSSEESEPPVSSTAPRKRRSQEEVATAREATRAIKRMLASREADAAPETAVIHCDKHGPYEATASFGGRWSPCPGCRAEEARQEVLKKAGIDRALRRAQEAERVLGEPYGLVPFMFQEATLETFAFEVQSESQDIARLSAEQFVGQVARRPMGVPNLILHGNTGVGKSHLGYAILRGTADAGRTAYRTSVSDLIDRIKASYKPDNTRDDPSELLKALSNVDVLILDEVGATSSNAHELSKLHQIIDNRWERGLPMVILSNLAPDDMADSVGGVAALSRLLSRAVDVRMSAPDGRRGLGATPA